MLLHHPVGDYFLVKHLVIVTFVMSLQDCADHLTNMTYAHRTTPSIWYALTKRSRYGFDHISAYHAEPSRLIPLEILLFYVADQRLKLVALFEN